MSKVDPLQQVVYTYTIYTVDVRTFKLYIYIALRTEFEHRVYAYMYNNIHTYMTVIHIVHI